MVLAGVQREGRRHDEHLRAAIAPGRGRAPESAGRSRWRGRTEAADVDHDRLARPAVAPTTREASYRRARSTSNRWILRYDAMISPLAETDGAACCRGAPRPPLRSGMPPAMTSRRARAASSASASWMWRSGSPALGDARLSASGPM